MKTTTPQLPIIALTPTEREFPWADHVVHSHDPQELLQLVHKLFGEPRASIPRLSTAKLRARVSLYIAAGRASRALSRLVRTSGCRRLLVIDRQSRFAQSVDHLLDLLGFVPFGILLPRH